MKAWRPLIAAAVLAGTLGAPQVARAEGSGANFGWGALATVSNLGYMPAKLVYALFGGLTGGLAYVVTLGDYDTSKEIWTASLGGTYVITPAMVRGEEPIVFAGMPEHPPIGGAAGGVDAPPVSGGVAATPPPPTPFEDRPISDSGY
jgi:hypothetical protein